MHYSHVEIMFFSDNENVERLSMLSEDTKLGDLRERITNVAVNEKNGLRIISMSIFLVCLGFVFSALVNNSFVFIGGTFISALGILSTLFGFYISVHYVRQYNNLLKELEHAL